MVVEEARECHEMAAQRKGDGQQRGGQQPPFLPPVIQQQAEQEEEDGDGAHVHRAGRERLRTPVEGQRLGDFVRIPLSGPGEELHRRGFVRVDAARRRAPVEVRDHQVRQLLPAVRPRRGIVELQAAPADFLPVRRGEFGSAAHRVFRIFIQRGERHGIRADAHEPDRQQQAGSRGETAETAAALRVCKQPDQFGHGIDQDDEGQVIRDLLVVGLDLQAERQGEQHRPEQRLEQPLRTAIPRFPVGVDQRGQHPGEEGQGLHLGIVSHLDDLQVVGAERNGHGADDGGNEVHPQGEHQQESPQQAEEEPGRRPLARQQDLFQGGGPVAGGGGMERGDGHPAEHRIGPQGGIVRMRSVEFLHLVGHAHIAGNVALVHDLPAQHAGDEPVGEHQEEGDDAQREAGLSQQCILVHTIPSNNSTYFRASSLRLKRLIS